MYICACSAACAAMNCMGRASIIYDERLTERLTLDGFPAEEAPPGLAARANRVLTGCYQARASAVPRAPPHRQDCGLQLG